MNAPDRPAARAALTAWLMATAAAGAFAADPNRPLLASLLAGQQAGEGCLPARLGLAPGAHDKLLADFFPGYRPTPPERTCPAIPEWEDLYKLLLDCSARERESEIWMAAIVATACAGADHLWQDLGLASRDELTRLMWVNFPELARANTGDMKWKKFLYREICQREGIYVCPAPSCSACKDYAQCFGPEK